MSFVDNAVDESAIALASAFAAQKVEMREQLYYY